MYTVKAKNFGFDKRGRSAYEYHASNALSTMPACTWLAKPPYYVLNTYITEVAGGRQKVRQQRL